MTVYRYYWDANVFHALFNEEKDRIEACRHVADMAKNGSVRIITSALTFVECVRLHKEPRTLTQANETAIRRFFESPFIEVQNVTRKIGEDARQLLWNHQHLKYKDAIHVATAIHAQCDSLMTYDEDDLVKLDGQISGLKIHLPPTPAPKPPDLFDLVQWGQDAKKAQAEGKPVPPLL